MKGETISNQLNKDKFLSKAEHESFELTLNKFMDANPRDVVILFVLLHTGARPTECLRICKKDLNNENGSVFLRGLKGSRDREIPLPPWLFKKLSIHAISLAADQRVFPIALRTLQHIWHQYRPCQGKGIKTLRHTFAIRLYEKTKDIRLVQMALGHRYLNTTQIYAEYIYNQEELKKLLL